VTLKFDLLILKLMRIIARRVGNYLLILVYLGLFVVDLRDNNYQTDHVTLRP